MGDAAVVSSVVHMQSGLPLKWVYALRTVYFLLGCIFYFPLLDFLQRFYDTLDY